MSRAAVFSFRFQHNSTTFDYDAFGRVTTTHFPSGQIEQYSYDNVSNLTGKTDRKNQQITYTYDQLNRLTQKSYPDTSTVNYTFDNDSRLTQVTDPTGTYQFTFDNMGRLSSTTTSYAFLTGRNFTTSYAYDAASNRTGFTDPENGSTSYVYDTLNRLQTLTPPAAISGGSFGFGYDALSRRTSLTRPNTVNTAYGYDNLSRLLSVTHAKGGVTMDGATYTVDNAGNRSSKSDLYAGVTTNFGYDNIYELLSTTQGGTTKESYSYDPVGNRLSNLSSSGWSNNTSNELTSRLGFTYTYDNNGNIQTMVNSSGTTTYNWDYENRMTSVVLPGSGGTVSFKYDPFGRRIYKSSSAGTSVFAYDGDNLVEETNATGAAVARYSQGLNIDEPLALLRSGTTSYYQADGLGSLTSLSNTAGTLANTYTYDSFGNLTASTGSITNSFRYTGREFDTDTSLYYYRARYYDPSTGRFLSGDTSGFAGGLNFYSYVGGNPVSLIDPDGMDWIEYTGQMLMVWPGKFKDRSGKPSIQCRATSGLPGSQSSSKDNQEFGPVTRGHYRINLALDPKRWASMAPSGDNLASSFGVQRIRDHYVGPNGGILLPEGWGTWRARLQKVDVATSRDNFYLHNSTKGYTHGCIETCDQLYQKFVSYHEQGLSEIDVLVDYTTDSTQGGTKLP